MHSVLWQYALSARHPPNRCVGLTDPLHPAQSLTFPDPAPIDLPLGKVVEWSVNHVAVHPLHTHVNPFQLQELPPASLLPGCQYSSWFEVGGRAGGGGGMAAAGGRPARAQRSGAATPGCQHVNTTPAPRPAPLLRQPTQRSAAGSAHPRPPTHPPTHLPTHPPACPPRHQAGDYFDVLNLPMMSQAATARIRLQPGEFPGYAV